ncbi:MAG: chemotaxis protein CheC [Nanoarchaeota archaeon]|nr:chemotaxis protein CheC [Nanoarchaeota archaeon]MBU1703882.1 chemotaxis protein CheC [Nanoarchaeota archaeon]
MNPLTYMRFKDALKEIGNMGSGKASAALSRLTGKTVMLDAPNIHITSLARITRYISAPKKLIVGIFSPVDDHISGAMITAMPVESAVNLSNLVSKKKNKVLKTKDKETLLKIGQLLIKSYLQEMAHFLKLKVRHSRPKLISAFGSSIPGLMASNIKNKEVILLKIRFNIPTTEIKGDFILLLGTDNLDNLVSAIKDKLK